MQGHFAVLPFKYDIYCILECIIIAFISLKSLIKMLYISYNCEWGGFLVRESGNRKTAFQYIFFELRYLT